MKQYSRVTYETRCQIIAFLQAKFSIPQIAKTLGFDKSTIYRELARNSDTRGRYHAIYADNKSKKRGQQRVRKLVINDKIADMIISKLILSWSPEQISGRLKIEKKSAPSHETIYRFIRNNPQLKTHLRWHNKRGFSRYRKLKMKSKRGISIHDRPKIINDRKRFGDRERDGMYGANKKQLLVCTERKSRYTIIKLMPKTNSTVISKLTLKVLKSSNRPYYSITNDNGTEFRGDSIKGIPVYYCDPLKPQQRGTIENTIGMLRRNISRKTDLEELGRKGIKRIEKNFNLKPRKYLGYKTPFEVFYNKKVALAV